MVESRLRVHPEGTPDPFSTQIHHLAAHHGFTYPLDITDETGQRRSACGINSVGRAFENGPRWKSCVISNTF
jgi:hypothetical protein